MWTSFERVRRAVFGGTDDEPLKHLGEAQTCHVLRHWPEFAGSEWVTDDREALRYARYQQIRTFDTTDLVERAVVNGDITADGGFALLNQMNDSDRTVRQPPTAEHLTR